MGTIVRHEYDDGRICFGIRKNILPAAFAVGFAKIKGRARKPGLFNQSYLLLS